MSRMKSELEHKLFQKLKEEFESATDFENYGSVTFELEIDHDYSDDEKLVCSVKIITHRSETFLTISIDEKETTKVNTYEDCWEEWRSYDWQVSFLWRQMFFDQQFIED